ncbi:cell envelope biogenesis protein AsmA [Thioclava dalianensis]|uniref:Cell envelope biogenesis protein AsmA n=1 Tax=Thioclava dalianensis TaxID=1185766 RepID=A0A074THR4_9RHOB|nr:AsmA family protein [Thioclava dalianensis]KEP71189.1 cell envelope biogenesis protein AsmA [Thioclava dalianensis]SFN23078.1 AsmA protein [Thioclava dalianensis]
MRWLFRALALIVLIALCLGGALVMLPTTKIAQIAEARFEAATGRKLTITGSVHASFWPQLGVRTGPVEIANADWSKDGPMLSAKGLQIGIDPGALIGGAIRVSKVTILSPNILLERRKDGTGNWQFTPKASTSSTKQAQPSAGGGVSAFSLDKGEIRDGSVTWIDRASGQHLALTGIDASLALPDFTGPANVSLTGKLNGKAVKAKGTLGAFASFLAGDAVPTDLALTLDTSSIDFKGSFGTSPLAAKGALSADLKEPAALAAMFGQPAPDLPKGLGRDTIAAKGDVTLGANGTLQMRGGQLTLDDNAMRIAGDLSFATGRPRIDAQIDAGALDLSALGRSEPRGSGGASGSGPSGWSTAPIDASGLRALDGKIALTANSIDLGATKLGPTKAQVSLDNGRAVVDLRQVSAYGGDVTGQVVANARSGFSASADLAAKGISMQPLLSDLADFKRLDAKADLKVNLLASGNSEAALMRSLSGSGNLAFGKGALEGLDLVGMLRTLDLNYVGKGAKTIFDKITASFNIANGVLSNDDLTFNAPLLSAAGKGRVDIGAQSLDYTVTPTALGNSSGTGGVTVPLTIKGPWAKLKYGVDVKAISGDKVDAAKKTLKQKADAEIAKKLGISPQDGQSTEDAAKQKLKEEAAKGLLKLFK